MSHQAIPEGEPSGRPHRSAASSHQPSGAALVPVIGIGVSGSELDALRLLLIHLPPSSRSAIAVLQYADATQDSDLVDFVRRQTAMPVARAVDGVTVEANRVYVIPPRTEVVYAHGRLNLAARSSPGHLSIDEFLESLARECGANAIGVMLSGAGTDGCEGLRAVRDAGGITIVQDSGTPPDACAAFVLPPEEIAAELARLAAHAHDSGPEHRETTLEDCQAIFRTIHATTGIDLSRYREKSIGPRVLRRLGQRNIGSIDEYAAILQADPAERDALLGDLLLGVTSFFRDPESFERLKEIVFPRLLKNRTEGDPIRIWVPGCATGEEAYSIAIVLREYLSARGIVWPVAIFASDISQAAVNVARVGRYLEHIGGNVSPERLSRFFVRVDGCYQIAQPVREMCVFSRHNLLADPPFSRLDMISCRNVLMYLRDAQRNIISRFHYALKHDGYLLLGKGEGAASNDSFQLLDDAHRIYLRLDSRKKPYFMHSRKLDVPGFGPPPPFESEELDLGKEVDRVLLSSYSPACVVVNQALEVLELRGDVSPFLKLPSGKLNSKLFSLITDTGLYLEIERLVRQAQQSREAAQETHLEFEREGVIRNVDVQVLPIDTGQRQAFLVVFAPVQQLLPEGSSAFPDARDRLIVKLRRELAGTRAKLMSLFEEHQIAREQSQNATEEALSNNEELQSLNEELETAKEELQSINETLVAVNQELQAKNQAVVQAGRLTLSIVETVRQPLLVLDNDLRIRRANRSFCKTFRLSPEKIEGQLLSSLHAGNWNTDDLRIALEGVLPENSPFESLEIEVDFPELGRRSLVLSGRRLDQLDFILLTIDDATERKLTERALRKNEEHLRQAQKMDAVGRLAGGIAHDFNNLLTAILGYSGLLLDSLSDDLALQQVRGIRTAADRAAALTQQLLSFSRRQLLQPSALQLNKVIAEMEVILRRLMGEQIQVVIDSGRDLWKVVADPAEISRAIMNLCLNARDAMEGGGTLTIQSNNLIRDDSEGTDELPAGRYVMLTVSDTGLGIAPDVKPHIFEPFFSTKEVGKDTGLGLATVRGIVEQSGGSIRCDSEPGLGTTFQIFLPALRPGLEVVEPVRKILKDAPKGNSEVILLVEDDDLVRMVSRMVLQASGYVVLEAGNARDGLSISESRTAPIDLLLTDVVMPGLGGRELAERMAIFRPSMKVLFMSGHNQDVVLREGVRKGMPFLQKPFRPTELARRVREVLDTPIALRG
jgi:two-component system CheB/CheR fusion protein